MSSKSRNKHQLGSQGIQGTRQGNSALAASRNVKVELSKHYQGPIPSPEMFAEYEQVLPGSADRILSMAETQSAHRMKLEVDVVTENLMSQRVGQWMAFVIVLAGMFLGTWLVVHGFSVVGLTAMFVPLSGVAGVFIWGRLRQESERQSKMEHVSEQPEAGGRDEA